MTPTVTTAHWDPRTATLDAEEDTFRSEAVAVIPVCPECRGEVLGYRWPGGYPQTSIREWKAKLPVMLDPCNHVVEPEEVGITEYDVQTRLQSKESFPEEAESTDPPH